MATSRASLLQIGVSLLLLTLLIIHNQYQLSTYGLWNDELETVVATRMTAAGLTLYREVFNQHGPLIFGIGLLVDRVIGPSLTSYRLSVFIGQWALLCVLYGSATGRPQFSRFAGLVIVCSILLLMLPRVFGQAFVYQTFAGLFCAIAITILVLPVLRGTGTVRPSSAVVGGLLLVSLPFLAVPYLAASAGLILCAMRRDTRQPMTLGIMLGLALNGGFVVAYCSISGLIVDHVYLNLVIYPAFGDAGWKTAVRSLVIASLIGQFIVFATAAQLRLKNRTSLWRVAALVFSIELFLLRGPDFQASPFYFCLLPLLYFLITEFPFSTRARQWAAGIAVLTCIARLSLLLPMDVSRLDTGRIPTRSDFSDLVKRYTSPSDRIVSFSFNNLEYVLAGRLPATADFFFLPQQAAYESHPILGVSSHPCRELPVARPKFVQLDRWSPWPNHPWASYGQCLDAIMQAGYQPVGQTGIYVRNDLVPLVEASDRPRDRD